MLEAYELLLCLARLLDGRSVYQAFGAPGDWGYGTALGGALYRHYSTPDRPDYAIRAADEAHMGGVGSMQGALDAAARVVAQQVTP